jgi:hypothetical protein
MPKGMPPKLSKETRTPLHNPDWPVARAIAFGRCVAAGVPPVNEEPRKSAEKLGFP